MPGWWGRHGAEVAVGAGLGGAAFVLAYPWLKDNGFGFRASGRQATPPTPKPPTPYRGDRARQGRVYTRQPAYVSDAGDPTLRDLGYTGYPIGPRASYPGAKGPTPPVPTYGSYGARRGGRSRLVIVDPQGPPLFGTPVQSVAEKNWDLYSDNYLVPPRGAPSGMIPIRAGSARRARTASVVGDQLGDFYNRVSLGNTVDIETQDFPGGEVGYNLSVSNPLPGAEGNLSAPVTYQQLSVPGGIAQPDLAPGRDRRPYLGEGGGGYLAFGRENGPAPGGKESIESVATAQRARQAHFPWWRPTGETGPLGAAAIVEETGYVSPNSYYVTADGEYVEPETAFRGRRGEAFFTPPASMVVPGYPHEYDDLVLANTIDIQTSDYPGGEVGANLSVDNLPPGANGTLSAPVQHQQLAEPGGIAQGELPLAEGNRQLLYWGDQSD